MSEHRAPEVDRLIVARLVSAAQRDAPGRLPTEAETAAAVRELREIGGRGDLLAEVAGLLIGYYWRGAGELTARVAAHYCIVAGADLDLIPQWIEVGRRRAAAARQASRIGPRAAQVSAWPGAEYVPNQIEPFAYPLRDRW